MIDKKMPIKNMSIYLVRGSEFKPGNTGRGFPVNYRLFFLTPHTGKISKKPVNYRSTNNEFSSITSEPRKTKTQRKNIDKI